MFCSCITTAYNAFIRYGQSLSWCKAHSLSFRALSRAVSIRSQLKKYMQRFQLPIQSCEGDAKRLRQCLVSGYWKNSAKWQPDGTYISAHGNMVSLLLWTFLVINVYFSRPWAFIHPQFCLPARQNQIGLSIMKLKKQNNFSEFICQKWLNNLLIRVRIRILTEIEPEW